MTTRQPSKFTKLLSQATIVNSEPEASLESPIEPHPEPTAAAPESSPARPSGPGRPKGAAGGKRSDPNYKQITAYISIDVHKRIKQLLMNNDDRRDFSELMQELLEDYIEAEERWGN